ncbi:unnamed protein product [Chrysodeixis includens]|uniref:Uncharacterized protein n=1 Tax=Chrysodeixis includens TaxID=689277 RepID=A0A9P0BGE0_CHRIL|nr:unnamed protein product [Chrysodeixis includens]
MINFRSKLLIIIKRANRCESSRRGSKTHVVRGAGWRRGGGVVSRRRGGVLASGAGSRGRRGTAQVAARIDRPGCALQCRRRDQPTHLLAEHHGTVPIECLESIVLHRGMLSPSDVTSPPRHGRAPAGTGAAAELRDHVHRRY